MKNILMLFVVCLTFGVLSVNAANINFETAYSQSDKIPMVTLVYAKWADNYQSAINIFREIPKEFTGNYNFVEMDIATPDAKYYNNRYNIYPKLPHVLVHKEGGKFFRFIPNECATDYSCLVSKLKIFIQ